MYSLYTPITDQLESLLQSGATYDLNIYHTKHTTIATFTFHNSEQTFRVDTLAAFITAVGMYENKQELLPLVVPTHLNSILKDYL